MADPADDQCPDCQTHPRHGSDGCPEWGYLIGWCNCWTNSEAQGGDDA